MRKLLYITVILLSSLNFYAQIKNIGAIPFIKYYSPDEYKAARTNWAAIQDHRGLMYFANTEGYVLEFDGQLWNRIKVSDVAVRSLCVDDKNNIFVGGNNSLGYLAPSKNGKLFYKSLIDKIPEDKKNFQDIWDIFLTKDSIIFCQSFDYIFFYDYDTIKTLSIQDYFAAGLFLISFQVNKEIYVYTKYKGLYKVEGKDLKFLPHTEILDSSMVRAVLPYDSKNNIVFTWFDGAFLMNDNTIEKIITPIDSIINHNVYRVVNIGENYYGFLLYEGGMLITDKKFNIIQFLRSPDDLVSQKIFKTYFDNQNNLWLCAENGITSIYLFSPFSKFDQRYGFENQVSCLSSLMFNNNLLIGTNSGVYSKIWSNTEDKLKENKFNLIQNPNGNYKINEIKEYNSNILVASAGGFFNLNNFNYQTILPVRGIQSFCQVNNDTSTLIGIAQALFIFKKSYGRWNYIRDFQGFKGQFIVQDKNDYFWISDVNFGLTRIKFDSSYSNIIESTTYNDNNLVLSGLPTEKNIRIFKIDNQVIFTTTDGVYYFDYVSNKFLPEENLNKIIGKNIFASFILKDSKGNYWYIKQSEEDDQTNYNLCFLKKNDTGYVLIEKPFLFLKNNTFSFSEIGDNSYIIGSESGFVHYDANMPYDSEKSFPVFIRSVKIMGFDSILFAGAFVSNDSLISLKQETSSIPILENKYNNLRFTFAGAFYELPDKLEYSYFLEGHNDTWSEWSTENYKDFSNLPKGEYTFKVKARNIYGTESSVASYKFTVKPPWYLTVFAFIVYFIFAGLIVWFIVYLYTRRLRKQKEYLEQQVKQRTKELEEQKEKVQKINKDITSSIEYAKRIQTAMLPLEDSIKEHLKDYFILFKPRDIVSGDFYWFSTEKGKTFIAAVDCTGHGVPGAFMSMIGSQILTTIVNSKEISDPSTILELLNASIRDALKQETSSNQDGMDMALCMIDQKNKVLEFSGAKNPIFYINNNELNVIKGNKQAIGGYQFDTFTTHRVNYQTPTWFYIFSDGYADQFGGEENSKFMVSRFKQLLIEIHQKPMDEQKNILQKAIESWMVNTPQTDDILVIGFKL